jgi:hypothetical protein
LEWQGVQWSKTFSPVAAPPCAYALSGMESAPAASMIEEAAARILVRECISNSWVIEVIDGIGRFRPTSRP